MILLTQLCLLFVPGILKATTDIHIHTSSTGKFGWKIPQLLESMERHKIEKAYILSAGYIYGFSSIVPSVEDENDFVAAKQTEHPDQLVGICSVPFYYEKTIQEIERCGKNLKLKGLKLHPIEDHVRKGNRVPNFNDPSDFKLMTDILMTATANNMFVLFHSWFLTGREIFYLLHHAALFYPQLRIVLIHGMAGQYEGISDIVHMRSFFDRALFPKVFLEISHAWARFPKGSARRKDWVRHVKSFGVENIVYGSDAFTDADIKDAVVNYQGIFGVKNFQKMANENIRRLEQSSLQAVSY